SGAGRPGGRAAVRPTQGVIDLVPIWALFDHRPACGLPSAERTLRPTTSRDATQCVIPITTSCIAESIIGTVSDRSSRRAPVTARGEDPALEANSLPLQRASAFTRVRGR